MSLPADHPAGCSRRDLLVRCANGFGAVALAALGHGRAYGRIFAPLEAAAPPARAKNVIFLYMDGGPSQVDTYDPKPRLERENGQPIGMAIPKTQFDNVGSVLMSPWKFSPRGESGIEVSDLLPHVAGCVDDIAMIRSMTSMFPEHTSANYFLHTGTGVLGRPSMGSWVTYGLGSENEDLPGFVVLNGGLVPPGGLDNFNSGFLPASFQGSTFRAGPAPVANLEGRAEDDASRASRRDLLRRLDRGVLARLQNDPAIEAAVLNQELAFRMQAAVPELMDLTGESELTRRMYGLDHEFEHTRTYGTLCLLARRLVERGVRFIELTCPNVGADRWDQHGNLVEGHAKNALAVDQPVAALLKDLKGLGLLDETLVIWSGEFGRTPMAQGTNGRDHNPHGFTIWMAGGGTKGGVVHGATDEYGYFAVEDKMVVHDLHATMLWLLGIDHKHLTFRFGGRDMRLTDVHGEVAHAVIA